MFAIDNSKNKTPFHIKDKLKRMIWNIVYTLIFQWLITTFLNNVRIRILCLFGAKIGKGSVVYSSAKIRCPWNLEMGSYSCIGPYTDIYSMDKIIIGNNVTISQYAVLCTGSHDISSINMKLITKPITIDDSVWVCAYAKIMPGVHLRQGSIVALGSIQTKNTSPWEIYAGNPSQKIKKRNIANG